MTKANPKYDTLSIGRGKIRFKFWPSENGPDQLSYYVGVLTHVKPETMDKIERIISKRYRIKGIFYPKP